MTSSLFGEIRAKVVESLELWEPRITVTSVSVTPDRDDAAVLYIDIHYRINDTNSPRNLVFPFYMIPGE